MTMQKYNNSTTMQPLDVKSFKCPYKCGTDILTLFCIAYKWPDDSVTVDIEEVVKGSAQIGKLLAHLNVLGGMQRHANEWGKNLWPIKNTGADTPEREEKDLVFDPKPNVDLGNLFDQFKTAI